MEKKVCVFFCSGCSIGDALNVSALEKVAEETAKISTVKTHPFLCDEDGINLIKREISSNQATHVVIGACSSRMFQDRFDFGPEIFVERVNLREHVVWSHEPNNEETQELAEDYVRMGIAKAMKAQIPEPLKQDVSETILVIGGGVTGMNAALFGAKAGHQVILVEKDKQLGGFASKLYLTFPHTAPYDRLQENPVASLAREVESNPNIKVILGKKVTKTVGAPGMFDVTIGEGENSETFRVGAIVVATGFVPYDPAKLTKLGYGIPNVVSSVEFEEIAKNGFARPSDGRRIKKVAFIQCAGSRDSEHLPYCSSTCCMTSLKQAHYLLEKDQDACAYIFYKDMRTPSLYEKFYEYAQQAKGMFLTKGEVTSVERLDDGQVKVKVEQTLLDNPIEVEVDLVVLAVGKVPVCENDVLNLTYRKGKELPTLKYGFPDSNFICFPYESQRTGIYTAGCVRAPMDIGHCEEDALGAMLKAIQCIYNTRLGQAVHPRAGDTSYPDFFLQRCTQCKRCTEECPFGTLDEDEKGTPKPNPTRCRRCGICMGACPERIISFKDYSVEIIGDMVKAIHVPDEFEEKPRFIGFICENDALPALDMAGINRVMYNPRIRFIPVRCLGSVNRVWIADALSRGIDGVMFIGCKYGDEYQCHFIKGSELCNKRMENVQEDLTRLSLEKERVIVVQLAINEHEKLPKIIDDFTEQVTNLGPNPYKGF